MNNPNATVPNTPGTDLNATDQGNRIYGQERSLAKKIADRANSVPGVDQAHAVVSRKNVAIGAVPEDADANRTDLENKIRSAVKPLTSGKKVYVTTDDRYVNRITTAETNFNAGKGMREVGADISGIINDLARALQRPFQNNSK